MKAKNEKQNEYPEFNGLDMSAMEKDILAFWEQNEIFKKSVESRPEDKPFVFYEGPPSANGKPGIHHVMSRTIKDLFCRYKTLQGYRVERKAGWDTHGLPVELNVEKQLGITKADIGTKITVAEYNKLCREDVMRFTDIWNDLTHKMGYWVDMDNPYVTYENNYIESLWALLKKLYDKGLLYEGYTIQPYSPAAGTGLSSHELNQPGCYRNVKDVSAIAQFKIKDEEKAKLPFVTKRDAYFLAWTTTPWTLPSNTALAVGKEISYVAFDIIPTFHPDKNPITIILAKDLAEKYILFDTPDGVTPAYPHGKETDDAKSKKAKPFAIGGSPIANFKGSDLEGIRYEQLLPYAQPKDGDAFRVLLGDFVTTTDGTGIVHIAPSFGSDDFKVAKQNGIGSLTLVDRQGKFVDEVNDPVFPLDGRYVKEAYYTEEEKEKEFHLQKEIMRVNNIIADLKSFMSADDLIVLKLKLENKLFKTEKYDHSYPHCWRTDKPVIYYPLDSWFIRTTAIKDRLIELNKTINWKPAHTGEGRFGQWLENLVDWNLSRSRYWGTPLPIWRTEDGSELKCIGSINDLKTEIEKSAKAGLMKSVEVTDLHKPVVDEIVLVSDSGKPMNRVPDLIDVWFDSGAMPYAQWHYPFESLDKFKQSFPADFIAEGVDQTRGWFFTLHVLAVALFDSVAYKNVVSNGLLLDKNGNKMSKRLGNVVDPFDAIEKYSADANRWYMIRNSDPWDNLKFDIEGVQDVVRAHYGTLYNTYSFFALYANIDRFVIDKNNLTSIEERTELDRWIISKLHSLIKDVTAFYNDFEPTKAARAIEEFVDVNLSNWHIRLSRRRFWKGEMSRDKQAAYETLIECLETVAQLMSPVSPFFSEWLYKNINRVNESSIESVHLSFWPQANESLIDAALEERMDMAQRVCSMVLSLRKATLIKVRQPLQKILIPVDNESMKGQLNLVKPYILSEVNVKEIEFVSDTFGIVTRKAKANFKTLGKKAGKDLKLIQDEISKLTQISINSLSLGNNINLELPNGDNFTLYPEDVIITNEDIPGWLATNDGKITVALDIKITEQLKQEGIAREIVNKVQNLRKDKDFQVLDRIKVQLEKNENISPALANFKNYIANEVLAIDISETNSFNEFDEIDINGTIIKTHIAVANN